MNFKFNKAAILADLVITIPARNGRNWGFARGVEWAKEQLEVGPRRPTNACQRLAQHVGAVETEMKAWRLIHMVRDACGFRHPAQAHADELQRIAKNKQLWNEDSNGFWRGVHAAGGAFKEKAVDAGIGWSQDVVEHLNKRIAERF